MTDPKPGLKLPLRIFTDSARTTSVRVFEQDGRWICDVPGYGHTLEECQTLAHHRAEVIVAALTADAERPAYPNAPGDIRETGKGLMGKEERDE